LKEKKRSAAALAASSMAVPATATAVTRAVEVVTSLLTFSSPVAPGLPADSSRASKAAVRRG